MARFPPTTSRPGAHLTSFCHKPHKRLRRQAPDGHYIATGMLQPADPYEIWLLDVSRGMRMRVTIDPAFDNLPVWHPDGHIVFSLDRHGGSRNLYVVQPRDLNAEPTRLATSDELEYPASVSPDGCEVYYREGTKMTAVSVSYDGDNPALGAPIELVNASYYINPILYQSYDVSPVDGHLLMMNHMDAEAIPEGATELVVVTNWFERLNAHALRPETD